MNSRPMPPAEPQLDEAVRNDATPPVSRAVMWPETDGNGAEAGHHITFARMTELFGRMAPTYDTVVPFFTVLGSRLVELAGVGAGQRVLDLACGRGASVFPASERTGPDGRVVAIDAAGEMLELLGGDLAARGVANVSLARMDACQLAFVEGVFDVVLCGFALHLFVRPEDAAARLYRVLCPDGRIAASAPTGPAPGWDFLAPLLHRTAAENGRRLPARAAEVDLAGLLRNAGFTEVEVIDELRSVVYDDEELWWRWMWSTGHRGALERLPAAVVEELRAEAFARLRSVAGRDGIRLEHPVRFVLARRP